VKIFSANIRLLFDFNFLLSGEFKEARALLGRLEFQRGNFDAALLVFEGIDIRALAPRMIRAKAERTKQRKPRSKVDNVLPNVMSMHSVSLLLEAILLKSKSLEELGRYTGITTFISLSDILHILVFCLILQAPAKSSHFYL